MLRKPLALAAVLALALLVALGVASRASADPALAGTFDVTNPPSWITAGPDGNVWFTFTSSSDGKTLGRIKPDGTVDEFDPPTGVTDMGAITAGPDGNLWAVSTGAIVKIPPADPASATKFTDANIKCCNNAITVGPDGKLWTGSAGLVIQIPTDNPGGGDTPHSGILSGTDPLGIAAGGDGNLWIADNTNDPNTSAIVRFDTAGNVVGTPILAGNSLQQSQIAAGPPGQVVFTEPIGGGVPERVGRVDYSGHVDFTDMPGGVGDPIGIVFGNDGAYWIANFGADAVRRMTPAGDVTSPITFDAGSGPRRLATGPNDTLWVSLETSKKIARITGVSAPPGGGGGGGNTPPDTTKPVVSSLHLSDRTFRLGSQLATFSKKKRKTPIGTTITFKVSEDSTVRFTFAKSSKGFRSGKKCVARKPKGKKRAKRCTRFKNVKPSLSFAATTGSHRLEFEGRLDRRHKLKPGRYRLSVVATDKAGNKSKARTVSLKVLKK